MRKKRQEEPENHERWLVSYADFITLLFAFFVVMYALSSVNEGKYRVLSDSLDAAFQGPARSLQPIQVGEIHRSSLDSIVDPNNVQRVVDVNFITEALKRQEYYEKVMEQTRSITGDMQDALQPLIDKELVSVQNHGLWIAVEMKTSILFASGAVTLAKRAGTILDKIAQVLRHYPNQVQVEGFTDNVPIHTLTFPSNWELSANRAATVVRLLSQSGVEPSRMVAMGYSEYRPKTQNTTVEGRRKNRRVVVTVLADIEKGSSFLPAGITERLFRESAPEVSDNYQANLDDGLLTPPNM
ncbi:MAG: flagellar motor protein MotD [Gammaproteobacteria bacterium]|nr:flagellar motor protein MotD [Gammaproteobacteria bacterium]